MPTVSRFYGIIHVTDAEYVGGYVLKLTFNTGETGEVDLEGELYGEMFAPLQDAEQFKNFSVDEEIDTVVWSNGADFSPEFLYEKMKERQLYVAESRTEYKPRSNQ